MALHPSLPDLGKRPTLSWIDKNLLSVDPTYQRTLSAHASQRLITKLTAQFCWAHCAPLIVTQTQGGWTVIDGQHRHQAALRRADIKDLPCYVVSDLDIKAQVKAFVSHNRDRVNVSALALFHSAAAAGEETEAATLKGARKAGVEILRNNVTIANMKPQQTIAIGAMTRIVREDGAARLTEVLDTIRSAHPDKTGQLRASTITAIGVALRLNFATPDRVRRAIGSVDGQALEDAARSMRGELNLSIPEGFLWQLLERCGVDPAPAMDKLQQIKLEHSRAQLKVIYEARKPAREAVKAARRAERERLTAEKKAAKANKPNGGGQPKKPFQFDRSKPGKAAPKPPPVIIRGDVKPRRFEQGTAEGIAIRTLEEAGRGRIESYMDKTVQKYRYRNKLITLRELLAKADEIRVPKGLPALTPVKKAG